MVSRGIWHKYRERYFKSVRNMTRHEAASDIWEILKYQERYLCQIPAQRNHAVI